MASISSMGIGSGLDVRGLIDQLVTAEQQPVVNRLNTQEGTFTAQISAYGNLRGAVADFQSVVNGLSDASAFQKLSANSSSPDVLTATADRRAATGRYDITVSSLAQAQSLATAGSYETSASTVGSGQLTIRFGTVTTDPDGVVSVFSQDTSKSTETITIDAGASSLADVRDAINGAGIGISASIVNDGSGQRLVLKSDQTGDANAFVIDVADDDGNDTDASGLSQLAFDAGAANLVQTRAAGDAALTIDGLPVSSATNTLTDAIEGVSLTLTAADPETTVTLDVSRNVGAVRKSITDFVSAYNDLRNQINSLTKYDAKTGERGPLVGDTAVRSIETALRSALSQRVGGLSGEVTTLADIGVTTERDGTLTLDSGALDSALSDHFDDVGALFAPLGLSSSDAVQLDGHTTRTAAGEYLIDVAQPATGGSYSGNALSAGFPLTIGDPTAYNFKVRVDGVLSREISLTAKTYADPDELAAEIQSRLSGDDNLEADGVAVAVSYDADSGTLQFHSASYGSVSAVEVQSADPAAQTALGLALGTGVPGSDVAGTIGGHPAEGNGRTLTGTGGDASGLAVTVTATAPGIQGSLRFSRGITGELATALDDALKADGILGSRTDGLQASIDALTPQREQLSRRMDALRSQLEDQFTRLDQLVASLNQTSTFLERQLSSLPGVTSKSK